MQPGSLEFCYCLLHLGRRTSRTENVGDAGALSNSVSGALSTCYACACLCVVRAHVLYVQPLAPPPAPYLLYDRTPSRPPSVNSG